MDRNRTNTTKYLLKNATTKKPSSGEKYYKKYHPLFPNSLPLIIHPFCIINNIIRDLLSNRGPPSPPCLSTFKPPPFHKQNMIFAFLNPFLTNETIVANEALLANEETLENEATRAN